MARDKEANECFKRVEQGGAVRFEALLPGDRNTTLDLGCSVCMAPIRRAAHVFLIRSRLVIGIMSDDPCHHVDMVG